MPWRDEAASLLQTRARLIILSFFVHPPSTIDLPHPPPARPPPSSRPRPQPAAEQHRTNHQLLHCLVLSVKEDHQLPNVGAPTTSCCAALPWLTVKEGPPTTNFCTALP